MARQRARRGGGSIFEAYSGFYLRVYISGKQKTFRLCDKNDANYSTKAKVVKELAAAKIAELHAAEAAPASMPANDMRVADFYEQHFIPFLQSGVEAGKKSAATVRFYAGYWTSYMREYFADETLNSFSTVKATNILNDLALKGRKQSTIQNCRALGSAIFKRAIKSGILGEKVLQVNPWREASADFGGEKSVTRPYGLQEIKDIIAALGHCEVDHTNLKHHAVEPHQHLDAQLFMSLLFFDALRPSECNGLRWEDFEGDKLSIQRSVENGIQGRTKTKEAQAVIPVAEDVQSLLLAWHEAEGKPDSGWLFHHKRNLEIPLNRNNFSKRVIRPCVEESKLTWKGYRGGRSGAATELTELRGTLVAAQQLLRHKKMTTTARYQKATEAQLELKNGMKQLAEKSAEAK